MDVKSPDWGPGRCQPQDALDWRSWKESGAICPGLKAIDRSTGKVGRRQSLSVEPAATRLHAGVEMSETKAKEAGRDRTSGLGGHDEIPRTSRLVGGRDTWRAGYGRAGPGTCSGQASAAAR